jgi:hypothetical protein
VEQGAASAEMLVQVGRIIGQLEGVNSRLGSQDIQISQIRIDVKERFDAHEARENPVLTGLDERIKKIERLVYIAIGSVMVLSAVIKFGLDAIRITMR